MSVATRRSILDRKPKTEDVSLPSDGEVVRVRGLTVKQRDVYRSSLVEIKGKEVKMKQDEATALLIVMSVVDENGARVFTDGDLAEVGEMDARDAEAIDAVARRLSGLTDETTEQKAKN